MSLPPVGSTLQYHPAGMLAVFAGTVIAHNDEGTGFRMTIWTPDGKLAYIDDPPVANDATGERPFCCPVPAFNAPRIVIASEIN